uniref:Proline rich transmembrane protein 3 n=1 Tax=Anas platyrhynchos platyrhynchos TaxID=8840 RepID=A0A493TC17_ANAPP
MGNGGHQGWGLPGGGKYWEQGPGNGVGGSGPIPRQWGRCGAQALLGTGGAACGSPPSCRVWCCTRRGAGHGTGGLSPSTMDSGSRSALFPQGEGLAMAAVWLVTWGLLLATGVPAGARGTLSVELPSDGTPQQGRDPLRALSWAHQQPVPSPAWDASGELSGAGGPDSEHWGGGSPVHWSPLPQPGAVTGAPRGTGMSLAGSAAPAVVEEPFIAWRGGEAEGQHGPWGRTRLPHGSASGTPDPKVPTDTGPGSPGPPWAAQGTSMSRQSATVPARTPGPRPTVSTIALTPEPTGGTRTGTSEAHTRGQTAAPGPPGEAQEPRGPPSTAPVPQPAGTGPAEGPHASPGNVQPTWGRRGDAGSPPSPSPALPSSVPLLLGGRGGPSWGLLPEVAQEGRAETWTWALPAHQRSTRRAPLSNATAGDTASARPTGLQGPQPTPGAALGTSPTPLPVSSTAPPGTPYAGLLPEQDVGTPQRVRGAVGPGNIPNATVPAPQPTTHPVAGTPPGTRRSDTSGTQPPATSTTASPSATWRRGVVWVTTQRAPWRPPAPEPEPEPEPSHPAPGASACPGSSCSDGGSNTTALGWAELRRPLRLAWAAHAYAVAALCLLLALGCLGGLGAAAALRPPHLPLLLGAQGLLLAASLLRATLLLLDPYGARGRLPPRALLLLCTAPFPLLLAAFALLLRRLQRLAQLRLLPSPLGGLPALGAAAALQSGAPAAADLLWPRVGLAAGLALHGLGCAAGALLLLLGGLRGGWRALRAPRREGPGLRRGARALLAAGALGLPCCGLQVYSALWLRGGLGPPGRCGWPCWAAQCWMRAGELGAGLALLAGAAEPLWGGRHGTATGHSCWAKALRYFCAGRKAQVPEYPNNCYDRAERAPSGDISKSLIRNPAEQLPLRALKDSNEARAGTALGAAGLSPKCPNAAAAVVVAARERGSSASLGDLAFRPPSPIDLRRSIDQALCRRHLLREGLFGRPRRGSGASLRATAEPPGLARCTSLTELPGPRGDSVASASSLESSSLKISWNPWRHGLSSPDSLPLEEAPSRAQL